MKNARKQEPEGSLSGALRMDGLVEYQNGAVVSKEVISKETGSVTLFAFDNGQGLSEHTAPYDALVYILEGSAQITISGQAHSLEKGEMIIMPAKQPHSVKALGKFKMALVMIRS